MLHRLEAQRRSLESARARFVDAGTGDGLRDEVVSSWRRCTPAVAVQTLPERRDERAPEHWQASPIHVAAELVRELGELAVDEDYLAAVTDADGQLLWTHGSRAMRRAADAANFVAGADWSETSAGTNAPGLTLATDRPSTVFAVEHWCEPVHDWVCYAAPVHDASGAIVGSIDLSARWDRASALASATVNNLARLIDQRLAVEPGAADAGLQLRLLGTPQVHLRGRTLTLPLRQLEILAVLALHGPCTLDELHAHVYGDRSVRASTLKAEISHLRKALGGGIASRPYRLTMPVEIDVDGVRRSVRSGALDDAVAAYGGQLLTTSEAPLLTDERHHLDVTLRTALLATGAAHELVRFAEVHPFDAEILETARARVGDDLGLAPEVEAALDRLRR